jgi:hypothetical protein
LSGIYSISGGNRMKISRISIIAIMLVVIAVAIAGCSSTSPTTPATGGTTPKATTAAAGQSSGGGASADSVSGGQLFGGVGYNWVEYKMSGGSGADAMTIYYKYDKQTGKCTMRFEGAKKIEGMPTEMDCSSTGGGKSQGDPNQVSSDVKFIKVGTEVVTVPAGTFTADKYTATYQGTTSTYWFVNGKPLIKMTGGDATGTMTMELNGMG